MRGEGRAVLQRVGNAVLVPVQGPVTHDLLAGLRRDLLGHLAQAGASGVVFDLSGVEVMDADDFAQLRRVVDAATLMGATVVLVGIQPGVAAGLVVLDADIDWPRTALTVDSALKELQGP